MIYILILSYDDLPTSFGFDFFFSSVDMKREEAKAVAEMKKLAKQGASKKALASMAKAVVKVRAQQDKLLISKVQLNSVLMSLQTMASQMRVAHAMKASTDLMSQMNKMMSVPKLQKIATEMSQEMYRSNMIEEQLNDAFEMVEDDDLETLADTELDKVLDEVLGDALSTKDTMKHRTKAELEEEAAVAEEDDMMAKLSAL